MASGGAGLRARAGHGCFLLSPVGKDPGSRAGEWPPDIHRSEGRGAPTLGAISDEEEDRERQLVDPMDIALQRV